MYSITPYTREQARRIGVSIKPSRKVDKKLDVYRDGKYLGSIGAKGMGDYPTYLRTKGKEYAAERRRLYKKRHQNDRLIKGSKGWFADNLLW